MNVSAHNLYLTSEHTLKRSGDTLFAEERSTKKARLDDGFSSTASLADESEESSIDPSIVSVECFFKMLKETKAQIDFPTRFNYFWSHLSPQEAIDNDEDLAGRYCWIERKDPKTQKSVYAQLLLFKDIFNSTSLDETAFSFKRDRWARIELIEHRTEEEIAKYGAYKVSDNLLEMHFDSVIGKVAGIDWIRKGNHFSGTEVKSIAMKISKSLKIPFESLVDAATVSIGENNSLSMRIMLSLTNHDKFPFMSWYERDGFIAMNGNDIELVDDIRQTQNTANYYEALEKIRQTTVRTLYTEVFSSTRADQETLIDAYRYYQQLKSKILSSNNQYLKSQILNDHQTTFSELLTVIWNECQKSKAAKSLCGTLYKNILASNTKERFLTNKNRSWHSLLKIIHETNIFVRFPDRSVKAFTAKKDSLLANLSNMPASASELQKLASVNLKELSA